MFSKKEPEWHWMPSLEIWVWWWHACFLTGRMVFSDYTKKRILFYRAKGSHARSHHTHAHSHHADAQSYTSLRVLFCSCSFRLSRSTALHVMASTLDRAQLLDYTRAGVRRYSKSATDTCVVHAYNLIVTRA